MQGFLSILAALTLGAAILPSLTGVASMPTMYKSWSTQECVRIEPNEGKWACGENEPPKYDLVWVK